jgi:hypothetical protein
VSVYSGSNYTVTIAPNGSHVVYNVSVNGTDIGNVTSYTFTNVQQNLTLNATFIPVIGVNRSGNFLTAADRRHSIQQSDYIVDCTDVPVYWDGTGIIVQP